MLRVGATEPTAVDLRVVAATLQSLEQRAATGRFRRDLYYRLAALRIALPPLRARRSDIPLLAQHFFRQLRGIDAPLDEDALAVLATSSILLSSLAATPPAAARASSFAFCFSLNFSNDSRVRRERPASE